MPILLAHGVKDYNVSYEHAQRMSSALESAGKKVDFLSLSEESSSPPEDETGRKAFYGTLLDFLARHLRGGRPYTPY